MSLFDDLPFPTFGQDDVEDFPLMDVNNNYLPQPFTNEEDSNGSIFDPDNNLVPPTSEIEDMPIPLPLTQHQASVRMETTQTFHLPTSFAEPMFSAMDPTTTFQLLQPCRPPPNEVAFPIPNIMDEVEDLKSENDVLEQRSCNMEQVQPSPRRQPLASLPVNCQHTPQKPDENMALDPLTPTTNLKMLMSAASPEIRNRDNMRRMLSEGIKIQQENRREQLYQQQVQAEDFKQEEGTRKDKSLGLLCQRFLEILPEFPDPNNLPTISLDTVSAQLGVERRRIYDIVNVLESVEMVNRVGKNRYVWNGKTRLAQTLTMLKARALSDRYQSQILRARAHDRQRDLNRVLSQHNSNSSNSVFRDPAPPSLHGSVRVGMRKEKSLSLISQKFVMLFLATDEALTLELAAKILSDDLDMDRNDSGKFKTKIRRLYDIANILMSLSLIEKVYGAPGSAVKTRKPGFTYVGPCLREGCDMRECACRLQPRNTTQPDANKKTRGRPPGKAQKKKPFVRHSSFDLICRAASQERERLYGSQPASPVRAPALASRSDEYLIPDQNVLKVEPEPAFSTSSAQPAAPSQPQKQPRVVKLAQIPYLRLNQLGKTELVITEINNQQHRTVTSLSSNMTSLLPSVKREGGTLIPEAKKIRTEFNLDDSEISRITDGVPMRVRSTPVHRVSPRALLFDNMKTDGQNENVKPQNEEKKFAKTVRIIPTNMMNSTKNGTPNKAGSITLVVRKQTPSQIPASRSEQYTTPVRVIHEKSITPNARATLFQATQAKLRSPKENAKLLNPRRVSFLRLAQGD